MARRTKEIDVAALLDDVENYLEYDSQPCNMPLTPERRDEYMDAQLASIREYNARQAAQKSDGDGNTVSNLLFLFAVLAFFAVLFVAAGAL